jgi:hypothetical protein
MKKILAIAFLIVLAGVSCKKIIDEIFKGIDVKAPEVSFVLPAIPSLLFCPGECGGIPTTTPFNLDSTIKANTAGVFGADDVKSIKIKEVQITIPNGDANNNLSNFQSARVTLSSDNNTTPVDILNLSFEDVPVTSKTITVSNGVELLPYLKGNELTYSMYGRLRKPTSKELTFVTVVTLRVE